MRGGGEGRGGGGGGVGGVQSEVVGSKHKEVCKQHTAQNRREEEGNKDRG